jgi:mRNA interferase MazF
VIRGAVYRIDLGRPRGHEQGGKRLGLVLSPSDSPLSVVTVIPTSTSAGPSVHRPEFEIAGRSSRMLIDQIRSIDTDYVVGDPVDYLTRNQLVEVELALAHYLGVQDTTPTRSSSSTR